MIRFDSSLLPPARLEFAVVADTHYMVDPGDRPLEFESRRQQGARARAAWEAAAALDPAFVVHMGDLVQEFPGRPDFERAVGEALAQIDAVGLRERCRFVAGNHDIGDKPDPTMPTEEVTAEGLHDWHRRFGPSWSSWDASGVHFAVLNSQLLNTDLLAEAQQRDWLLADLAGRAEPCVLFLHVPPYLCDPDEPSLGHYDNIAEPGRGWLLDVVRQHRVIAVFTAHVHFRFFDRPEEGGCRLWGVPSTSFTRPGFGHLFTSAAPPEQGRDDVAKTGLFLCRVVGECLHVHLVRTGPDAPSTDPHLLTPLPGAVPSGVQLGVTSHHVFTPRTQVPVAYPSAIRQPVRNDYPLLACLELGAGRLRVPAADLLDPLQAGRFHLLRQEGVGLQFTALGEEEAVRRLPDLEDGDVMEVQLPGRLLPEPTDLRRLSASGRALAMCPVLPFQPVPGKQHPRTRTGYLPAELDELDRSLDVADAAAAAVCRIDGDAPWEAVSALATGRWRRIEELVLLLELPGTDDACNACAVARGLVAGAALGAQLFVEPLVDLDRTMDVRFGLLDTLCNPRPAFHVARTGSALLGRVLSSPTVPVSLSVENDERAEVVRLSDGIWLVLPRVGTVLSELLPDPPAAGTRVGRLAHGTVAAFDAGRVADPTDGPLLVFPAPQ